MSLPLPISPLLVSCVRRRTFQPCFPASSHAATVTWMVPGCSDGLVRSLFSEQGDFDDRSFLDRVLISRDLEVAVGLR